MSNNFSNGIEGKVVVIRGAAVGLVKPRRVICRRKGRRLYWVRRIAESLLIWRVKTN